MNDDILTDEDMDILSDEEMSEDLLTDEMMMQERMSSPEIPEDSPSALGAFGRGALDVLTFGNAPEVLAAGRTVAGELMGTPRDYRGQLTAEMVERARAEREQPVATLGGQLATGLAPMGAIGGAKGAATALGTGGAYGLSRTRDVPEVRPASPDEPAKQIVTPVGPVDYATSGAIGVAGGALGVGAGKALSKAIEAPKKAVTAANKVFIKDIADVSDEMIADLLKNPEAVKSSRKLEDISEDLATRILSLRQEAMDLGKQAKEYIPDTTIPISKVEPYFERFISESKKIGEPNLRNSLLGYFDSYKKNLAEAFPDGQIPLKNLKAEVDNMSERIPWDQAGRDSLNKNRKQLRYFLNEELKKESPPEVRKLLDQSRQKFDQFDDMADYFGNTSDEAKFIDNVSRKLKSLTGAASKTSQAQQKALTKFDREQGTSFDLENKSRAIREYFEQPIKRGSRNVNLMGGLMGGGAGAVASGIGALPFVPPEVAAFAGLAGGAMGALKGARLENTARPIARDKIIKYLSEKKAPKPSRTSEPLIGSFGASQAPEISFTPEAEMELQAKPVDSEESLRDATKHYLRMKQDPKYRQKYLGNE